MPVSPTARPALCLALSTLLWCCGGGDDDRGHGDPEGRPTPQEPRPLVDDPEPPTARWEQVNELEADLVAQRHPADGGGSARLELAPGEQARVRAGDFASWTVVYTTGPLGIAEGGALHFMPEPFWGWSVPQTRFPGGDGFTGVTTEAEGVELEPFTVGGFQNGYLVIRIHGRALEAGETLRIEYGVEGLGALADRHAERSSHLWLYVDGDGDGVRGLLEDSPTIDVLPRPPSRLVLTGPSVARTGETLVYTLAVLDDLGNAGPVAAGEVRISNRPKEWEVPGSVALAPQDRARKTFEFQAATPGVLRLRATLELDGVTLEAEANPLWINSETPRVYWGDLHGHSNYSDGTGLPEDWYTYARDVAALDVAVLTDHDHFGVRFLDSHPALWEDIQAQTEAFHDPGRFVTVLGYEWTSWIHGHRHVLYFDGEGDILSSLDPRYRTPRQLWDALRGRAALTFAHHSAGDPIPTNWTFVPDPELEPVTEVMSVHGSSEAADCPRVLRRPVRGNFVRDVLDRGLRFGFVGSGDGHDGHPGLAHLSPVYGWRRDPAGTIQLGTGGLAGILADELTRTGVLAALRSRRTYATSGPRILLHATLEGHPMGASIPEGSLPAQPTLHLVVLGTAGLSRIDLVRRDGVRALALEGERRCLADLPVADLQAGEYVYVRVLQQDGGMAWSSPFYVR